ncbi:unnamed protein product, partial [Ectocarpus sp. 8 AP-2014]
QCIYFYIFVRACRGHMLLVAVHVLCLSRWVEIKRSTICCTSEARVSAPSQQRWHRYRVRKGFMVRFEWYAASGSLLIGSCVVAIGRKRSKKKGDDMLLCKF